MSEEPNYGRLARAITMLRSNTIDGLHTVQRSEMTALQAANKRIAHLEQELAISTRQWGELMTCFERIASATEADKAHAAALVLGVRQMKANAAANERATVETPNADSLAGQIVNAGRKARGELH